MMDGLQWALHNTGTDTLLLVAVDSPFLDWEQGWLVAMFLIVALAAGTYFLFKRQK